MQFVPVLTKPLVATGAIAPCRFVTAAGAQAAANVAAIGVAREAATTGGRFSVDMLGTAIVEAGAAVTAGVAVQSDAQGRAIPHTSTNVKTGVALQGATAAGQMIEIFLMPSA